MRALFESPLIVVGLVLMGYVLGERLTKAGDELCSNALVAIVERMNNYGAARMSTEAAN